MGKVVDYPVRIWDGGRDFYDRYAPGRYILSGKNC